jgi:Ca2+-binding EF-hand superfamily protein
MRTIRAVGVALAVLAGAGSAWGQQEKAAARFRDTIIQLDANGDMVIERDEVPEAGRAAFDRLLKRGDTNKNGKLEIDELRGLVGKLRALAGAAPGERFQAMDKNGDGKVSKEEFTGPEPLFARIDADKDGFLTRAEVMNFAAATGGGRPALERLKAMDKDGDGKVSKQEFTGPEPLFARLDADKDGFITQDEATRLGGGPADAPKPKAEAPKDAPRVGAQLLERLKTMDKDGDGKISRSEFTGRPQVFDRLDADKDGFLTKDEIDRAAPAKDKKDAGDGKPSLS